MPANLALADLVAPYLLKADALGQNHAAFSLIMVTAFEVARDDFGTVIRGTCEFSGRSSIDVTGGRLVVTGDNDEMTPVFDPSRRNPVFDLRETRVEFELFAPLVPSTVIQAADASVTAAGFAPARAAMADWQTAPNAYPGSSFVLDLVLVAPTLRPPFLQPAALTADGTLMPHPSATEVVLTLPRLRFRLDHDVAAPGRLNFGFMSAGVAGLDDPGAAGAAELISMDPPHAFIGGKSSRTIGFAFRRAILDLADGYTPPEILDKFGFGDDWGGLYLPEVRFFASPQGARGFALEVGVRDLLIGFGDDSGVSGDFEIAVVNQGGGALLVGARFFDEDGKAYGAVPSSGVTRYAVALPPRTRMVVDVQGGRPPYQTTAAFGGGAPSAGRLFLVDMSGTSQQTIVIDVRDTSTVPIQATITIVATRRKPDVQLATPGPQVLPPGPATLSLPPGADPVIVVAGQTDEAITLTLQPRSEAVFWSLDGGSESGPRAAFTAPLARGETKSVRARIPGQNAPDKLAFYFFFDRPELVPPADEANALHAYAAQSDKAWTTTAASNKEADGRLPGGERPEAAHRTIFETLLPPGSSLISRGEASVEADLSDAKRDYNYHLARRRAIAARELIVRAFPARNFQIAVDPEPIDPGDYPNLAAWTAAWKTHSVPNQRDFWVAHIELPPNLARPERQSTGTVQRGQGIIVPVDPVPVDPPPEAPPPPPWFRSARLKARIVRNSLVAFEVSGEIDIQTAAEESLIKSGQAPGAQPTQLRSLQNGAPIGANNAGDGITDFRLLVQHDDATDLTTTLIEIRADPTDIDGLVAGGWLPGEPQRPKDFWLTLLGSYLSFWPLLVTVTDGNKGRVEDVALAGAALALPGAIAALPWFQIERVILFGGELVVRDKPDGFESFLLFDVEADWSVKIAIGGLDLVTIPPDQPLAVRYKAIGLRLDVREQTDAFPLRPVFDASRGYTIELAKGAGGLQLAAPFDKILKVLAARISKSNPLTFEIDLALGVDLGVVSIERCGVRVYLDGSRPPELTALKAKVDVPGALIGEGFVEISSRDVPGGKVATIGGELDLTLRPLSMRIAAAVEVAEIDENGRKATGVYVGLSIVLPVGIPLGTSGLGIFGFRGIFGMHYARNADIGAGKSAPALEWLKQAQGEPHRLVALNGQKLWIPKIDNWAFGVGALLGTMEGGVLINLDGTLLIELPGPRLLITLNMRYLSPPPSVGEMGAKGGLLAVIEITPEHFLLGVIASYEIIDLIKIKIPAEAFFDFADTSNWHFYLGQRSEPFEVDVLGIVKGFGYVMVRGNGLPAYKGLPEISGFALGVGAGASLFWGSRSAGLYLEVHGGFDAVIGFDPFILGGVVELGGELRLFIISIGAHAKLTLIVRDAPGGPTTFIKGEACGKVEFLFFSVEGCVDIEIGTEKVLPPIPALVKKVSIKSRSPALAQGTGVGRPVDASLGDAIQSAAQPAANDPNWVTVPIDAIPIVSLDLPPRTGGLTFNGQLLPPSAGSPGLPASGYASKGAEEYGYTLKSVEMERVSPAGPPFIGTHIPATWQPLNDPSDPQPSAALALLTWEPTPASKIFEKSKKLEEWVEERWGRTCDPAAPAAPVFWTFRLERLGPSNVGWDLEGIAWPDPPGSKRSVGPDTTLQATERWRSGNPDLDQRRGIQPALIISGFVACATPGREGADVRSRIARVGGRGPVGTHAAGVRAGRLVDAADPALDAIVRRPDLDPFRVSERFYDKAVGARISAPAPLDLAAAVQQMLAGGAVSAGDFAGAMLDPQGTRRSIAGGRVRRCEVRLLQAPRLDNGRPLVFGDDRDQSIERAIRDAGVTHGPLDDVIELATGAFIEGGLLLFIRREVIERQIVKVRVLDADGNEIAVLPPPIAVNTPADLPGAWVQSTGPWADDTNDLLAYRAIAANNGYLPVYQRLDHGKAAASIEVGVLRGTFDAGVRPAYLIAAIGLQRLSEARRAEWDHTETTKSQATIVKVLGPTPTDDALMFPGSVYKVTATWSAERKSGGAVGDTPQAFWFRTDATPPPALDPWVLVTRPEDGEAGVFGREPLRIAFNTHDVDRLYAAYGKELRMRFQAASGAHPSPQANIPHPWVLAGTALVQVGPAMLSPWEEVLTTTMQGRCVPIDESRDRHTVSTIPIPLDPYTDYIVDVEMVNVGAPAAAVGDRVYRRRFSTGAYGLLSEFAAAFQATRPRARAVPAGAVAALTGFFAGRAPQGAELDERLRAAGIEAKPVPATPAITVLWETVANVPQPTAVLVDAPEAMWRERLIPTKVVDNDGPEPVERYQLRPRAWLSLAPTPGSAVVLAPNAEIRGPGGTRALIALPAGARGKRLQLDFVRHAEPESYLMTAEERFTVIDIEFAAAPWEE